MLLRRGNFFDNFFKDGLRRRGNIFVVILLRYTVFHRRGKFITVFCHDQLRTDSTCRVRKRVSFWSFLSDVTIQRLLLNKSSLVCSANVVSYKTSIITDFIIVIKNQHWALVAYSQPIS